MEQRNGRIDRKLQRDPRSAATTSSTRSARRTRTAGPRPEDRDDRESWAAFAGSGAPPCARSRTASAAVPSKAAAIERDQPGARNGRRWRRNWKHVREREGTELRSTRCGTCRRLHHRLRLPSRVSATPSPARWNCSIGTACRVGERPTSSGGFPAPGGKALGSPWRTPSTRCGPHGRGIRFWEWRREAPSAPSSSRPPASLDEVVHLHLEHRVVQRLLGRFLAPGLRAPRPVPRLRRPEPRPASRVVLLGASRSTASAPRAADEIIAVAARWIDPVAARSR